MAVRGTRIICGEEARLFDEIELLFSEVASGFESIRIPSLEYSETFSEKHGKEILRQMYTFNDKKGRDLCLVPEITGTLQRVWRESWNGSKPNPYRVRYSERCYRYEKPQKGRYREFTQLGVEILGKEAGDESKELLICFLDEVSSKYGIAYTFNDSAKRGLSYYTEDGFEASIESLGAQKQIAGGGKYSEGQGWAVGLDRLVLAILEK